MKGRLQTQNGDLKNKLVLPVLHLNLMSYLFTNVSFRDGQGLKETNSEDLQSAAVLSSLPKGKKNKGPEVGRVKTVVEGRRRSVEGLWWLERQLCPRWVSLKNKSRPRNKCINCRRGEKWKKNDVDEGEEKQIVFVDSEQLQLSKMKGRAIVTSDVLETWM